MNEKRNNSDAFGAGGGAGEYPLNSQLPPTSGNDHKLGKEIPYYHSQEPIQTQAQTQENVNYPNMNYFPNYNEVREQNINIEHQYEAPIHPSHSHRREVIFVERPIYYLGYEDPYPILTKGMAWLILVINIFLPGIGTMIVGCLTSGINTWYFFLIGFLQLITTCIIIGWVFAIWTSILLIIKAE
jgi:hypothetical protein